MTPQIKVIKGAIFAQKYDWQDEYEYSFIVCKDSDFSYYAKHGYIFVQEHEIAFEEPAKDTMLLNRLKSLETKKNMLMADHNVALNKIEEDIQSLLCLEYKEDINA